MYFRIYNPVLSLALFHFDDRNEHRNVHPSTVINFQKRVLILIINSKIFFCRTSYQQSKKRYIIACLVSYGLAIALLIVTGIIEASASRCSVWKPRFNEENCFFSGMYYSFFTYYRHYSATLSPYFCFDIYEPGRIGCLQL